MPTVGLRHEQPNATDRLIADALSRMDNGVHVDLEAIKREHPESAEEIDEFFSFPSDLDALMRRELDPTVVSLGVKSPARSTGEFSAVGTVIEEPAEKTPEVEEPTQIGRYLLKGKLGQGTFGHVYRGFDPETSRTVAIKQMVCRSLDAESTAQLFRHEAKTVAALDAPGIVRLLDIVADDSTISLVFEHVDGPTLHKVFKDKSAPTETLVGWIAEVADALAHAHRQHIVHRDLKPANIMLKPTDNGFQPVLLDFGLASAYDQYWRDGIGQRIGSYAYMSPEQAAGTSEWATPQSDIFSLGVMLYQVLTGVLPFKSKVETDLLRQIQKRTPAAPRSLCSTISADLERACMKAMEKRPGDRYSTADDFASDLRKALEGPADESVPLPEPSTPNPQRSSMLPWAIGSGAAALAAVLAMALWLGPESPGVADSAANAGGTPDAVEKQTPVAQAAKAPVQEVELAIQVHQPDSDPITLSEATRDLSPADRFRITAQTAEETYLYAIWYGADNSATVLETSDNARRLLQSPAFSNSKLWTPLADHGEGYQMVVVFSCSAPLTPSQLEAVKQADWHTPVSQGEGAPYSFNQIGYPAVSGAPDHLTRAFDAQTDQAPPSRFPLGQLAVVLRDQLAANYQAILFRVAE